MSTSLNTDGGLRVIESRVSLAVNARSSVTLVCFLINGSADGDAIAESVVKGADRLSLSLSLASLLIEISNPPPSIHPSIHPSPRRRPAGILFLRSGTDFEFRNELAGLSPGRCRPLRESPRLARAAADGTVN